jgi:hypothetical protein
MNEYSLPLIRKCSGRLESPPSASCTQGMVTTEWELLKRKLLVQQGMERVPNDVVGQSPLPPSPCRWTEESVGQFFSKLMEYAYGVVFR